MSLTVRKPIVLRPMDLAFVGRSLAGLMVLFVAIHLVLLLVPGLQAVAASRYSTAALAGTTALCAVWRAVLLPLRERVPWLWAALAIALWAAAHALGAQASSGAAILPIHLVDFIHLSAIFSLVFAFATPREMQSVRTVLLLNLVQIALALLLAWVLLDGAAGVVPAAVLSSRIYTAAAALLALLALIRIFCWSTPEEHNCFRTLNLFVWTWLPIELAMNDLFQSRGPRAGAALDLAWAIPFGLAGWFALTLPLGKSDAAPALESRARLLADSLCPLLLNLGIFALAAAILPRQFLLGLFAMLFLLLMQGFQAAIVQTNYLIGRNLLLDREQKLRLANASLEQLTLLDPLTGISNRRGFDAAFDAAWRRALRRRYPLALLLVDVDFFKAVNDLHGHPYGDECLVKLARVMEAQARRPDDLVARLGGEEFIILLPESSADAAVLAARRLHESIRNLALANQASPYDRLLTVSIGIAICIPSAAVKPATLFESADQALYTAKDQGRNRTYSVLLRSESAAPPPPIRPGPPPRSRPLS